MFAVVIIDERRERVVMARDHLGIKPLYVADLPTPHSTPDPAGPIVNLLDKVTGKERDALWKRLRASTPPPGAAASNANRRGTNYLKQVDVVMSNWIAGPELLISTKRMDSSFGKNAANRVEEFYGDAKNLRHRHPLAVLSFVYGPRSSRKHPTKPSGSSISFRNSAQKTLLTTRSRSSSSKTATTSPPA